uniref:NADH-ubiquinone oxidoreductase chain 4 n=1 Tax=Nippostrongylus brasiliensis TaxID=27835 RepID=A0A0N4XFT0_NIPBR
LFLSLLFFYLPTYFVFFLLLFRLVLFNNLELNFNLILLRGLLILICLFFFVSRNILILYIFFELSMFPILIIILGFGAQVEKIGSGYYLLFYARICSFPFLFIYYKRNFMFKIFFILSLRFIIKFPAPTTARMLLAGLLLKLGTAGFILYISLIGIILAAVTCTFQRDSKSLAAYSSVTHISFLLLSLSLILIRSKVGGLITMLAHGYTSTLIFYFIGEFYHSSSRRIIYFINRFFSSRILFGIIFSLVFLSNRGVPPSLAFLAEFIIIINRFIYSKLLIFFIFLYFMIAFYYSLFLIINSLMGKILVNFNKTDTFQTTSDVFQNKLDTFQANLV